MERQQFWETLKHKYEEKNRILQQREQDLRLKLEALETVVGGTSFKVTDNIEKLSILVTSSQKTDTLSDKKTIPSIASRKTNEEVIVTHQLIDNIENVENHTDFKYGVSTTSSSPPEKSGLFNCIWSLFSSAKTKPSSTPVSPAIASAQPVKGIASAAAPQDAPTKENPSQLNKINLYTNFYENENCQCNPCGPDFLEQTEGSIGVPKKLSQDSKKQGSASICNCSICTRSSLGAPSPQNPVSMPKKSSHDSKKQENSNICNCSICSETLLSTVPDQKTEKNYKYPDSYLLKEFENTDKNTENLSKNIELSGRSMIQNNTPKFFSPSKLSLKSLDLFYMKNIYDLANQEKEMLKQINALETKEKIYENVLKEYKDVDLSPRIRDDTKNYSCPCYGTSTPKDSDPKSNAELKLENFLLKNELKDMKLEIRQYIERMEGPMQFKVESEKYKCHQLEQKLEEAAKETVKLQEFYDKEINALKMQLCSANTNIYNLTTQNANLTEDMIFFREKCSKLEEDLIRQKISEAETIKSLQASLNAQVQSGAANDECDLHQIARELSKLLKECEPCGDCLTLPGDLTTAAFLLKSLTDMVGKKLNYEDEPRNEVTKPDAFLKTGIPTESGEKNESFGMAVTQKLVGPPETLEMELKVSMSKPESADDTDDGSLPVDQQLEEGANENKDRKSAAKSEIEKTSLKENINFPTNHPLEQTSQTHQQLDIQQNLDKSNVDQRSEPINTKVSEVDKKSEGSTQKTDDNKGYSRQFRNINNVETKPKSKSLCKCVKSKKSVPPVDQIWPAPDKPLVMKDSSTMEASVPNKNKCDCSIARQLREQAQIQASLSKGVKKLCKCNKRSNEETKYNNLQSPALAQIRPSYSERFKLCHQVTASKSKDLLQSKTSVKCLKVKENFPFDIDTQVDVINKPPDGVHVTTTITKSGTLEVITEGPEGVIETTLVYTNSGNVEVVTEILEFQSKGKSCKRGKGQLAGLEISEIKALEPSEPKNLAIESEELSAKKLEEIPIKTSVVKAEDLSVAPNCECLNCPQLNQEKPEEIKEEPTEKVEISTEPEIAENVEIDKDLKTETANVHEISEIIETKTDLVSENKIDEIFDSSATTNQNQYPVEEIVHTTQREQW